MKKLTLLLFTFLSSSVFCPAQSQFQLAVGGGTGFCYAYSIIQTADGGYAVAGRTSSFGAGNDDFYVVKLDASGTLQWTRTIGGASFDWAYCVRQTTDGGYVLSGYTASFGAGYADFYLVKLNSNGTLQWSRTAGGPSFSDFGSSSLQTTDGGYIITGYTWSYGAGNTDCYIVKFDAAAVFQWSRAIGGTGSEGTYSILQTSDGGYAAAGFTNSFGAGNADVFIIRLNGNGALQWARTVGGTGDDGANSVIRTTDGGYAAIGYSESFGISGSFDCYIVKLDSNGALQWTRTVGSALSDYGYAMIQTTDGGYLAAGSTQAGSSTDCFVVKLDPNGSLQWSKTIGGTGFEYAYSIIQTSDGGYIVAGETWSFGQGSRNFYIVKLDANGNTCGNSFPASPGTGSGGTLGTPIPTVTSPSPVIISPSPQSNTGGTVTNICFVSIQPATHGIPSSFELYQNYPNPFNPKTILRFQLTVFSCVKLNVYDALGKEIAVLVDEELKPGTYEVQWDASNFPSGVYYYKLSAGNYSATKKMVLMR